MAIPSTMKCRSLTTLLALLALLALASAAEHGILISDKPYPQELADTGPLSRHTGTVTGYVLASSTQLPLPPGAETPSPESVQPQPDDTNQKTQPPSEPGGPVDSRDGQGQQAGQANEPVAGTKPKPTTHGFSVQEQLYPSIALAIIAIISMLAILRFSRRRRKDSRSLRSL